MAIKIDRADNPDNYVEFEVPDGDTTVLVTLPKLDCIPPILVARMRKLQKEQPDIDGVEFNRESFKLLDSEHKKVFDALVARQVLQIAEAWQKESEIPVGESSASES